MITRSVIALADKKFNEALREEDDRKGNAKAFISGAIEGYADAALMMYPVVLIACWYWKAKADKK